MMIVQRIGRNSLAKGTVGCILETEVCIDLSIFRTVMNGASIIAEEVDSSTYE